MNKSFSEWLSEKLKTYGRGSGQKLAEALGVEKTTVYAWTSPKRNKRPSNEALEKIAEFFGVPVGQLRAFFGASAEIDSADDSVLQPYTSFLPVTSVAREETLRKLISLVADNRRLISILGAPGTGRGKLAMALATHWRDRVAPSLRKTVFIVSLADFKMPERATLNSLESSVAHSIGANITFNHTPEQRIRDYIGDRGAILVLLDVTTDILSDVSIFVKSLIERSPNLCVVVTAEKRLRVREEEPVNLTELSPQQAWQIIELPGENLTLAPESRESISNLLTKMHRLTPLILIRVAGLLRVADTNRNTDAVTRNLWDSYDERSRLSPTDRRYIGDDDNSHLSWLLDLLVDEDLVELLMRLSVFSSEFSSTAAYQISGKLSGVASPPPVSPKFDDIDGERQAIIPVVSEAFDDKLHQLLDYGWLSSAGSVGAITYYRLGTSVRDWLRTRMPKDKTEKLQLRHAEFYAGLSLYCKPVNGWDTSRLTLLKPDIGEIEAALQFCLARLKSVSSQMTLEDKVSPIHLWLCYICQALRFFWERSGLFEVAIRYLSQALELMNDDNDNEMKEITRQLRASLGIAFYRSDRILPDACREFFRVLLGREDVTSPLEQDYRHVLDECFAGNAGSIGEALALRGLGVVRSLTEPDDAGSSDNDSSTDLSLQFFAKSASVFEERNDSYDSWWSEMWRGRHLFDRGNLADAALSFQRCLRLAERRQDARLISSARVGVARTAWFGFISQVASLDIKEEKLAVLRHQLRITESSIATVEDRPLYANFRCLLALYRKERGQREVSDTLFSEGFRGLTAVGDQFWVAIYRLLQAEQELRIGSVARFDEQYKEAIGDWNDLHMRWSDRKTRSTPPVIIQEIIARVESERSKRSEPWKTAPYKQWID